jgi:hypothetical protein
MSRYEDRGKGVKNFEVEKERENANKIRKWVVLKFGDLEITMIYIF